MRSLLLTASLLSLAGCRPTAGTPNREPEPPPRAEQASGADARWSYELRLDPALERMDLALCVEGQLPKRLVASREAIQFVEAARVRGGPALEREGRTLKIETLGEHGCVDLVIDLEDATDSRDRDAARLGDTVLAAPDRWLWYPGLVPERLDARARFELPDGVHATVPWPELDPGDAAGWRSLDSTSFGWNAWIAFGRYQPIRFEAAGCEFEVAILDGDRAVSEAGVEQWLRVAAETSAALYGRFPRERVAVVVIPTAAWGEDAVLFGMARRGGGGSVMLLLDEQTRDEELPGEWVAVHELLHLGMPLIAEPWLAEGFVTYYTQVLRARLGLLGPGAGRAGDDMDAIDDLDDDDDIDAAEQLHRVVTILAKGFEDRPSLRSLAAASETMRQTGSYRRVYWGGAAVAFDLDRSIRIASNNRRSLDDLMRLLEPLAPEHRRYAADELLARMDEELRRWREAGELEVEISPSAIADRHLRAKSIPADVQRLRGIAVETQDGEVRLLDNPIGEVQLRTALFGPKAKAP